MLQFLRSKSSADQKENSKIALRYNIKKNILKCNIIFLVHPKNHLLKIGTEPRQPNTAPQQVKHFTQQEVKHFTRTKTSHRCV